MDSVTAAQQCANAGDIDLDSQAGATILEHSRRFPKLPGWAVVAKILSDEVTRLRGSAHSDEHKQRIANAVADQLHHPSNGLHMSHEGIAGVVYQHLNGNPD